MTYSQCCHEVAKKHGLGQTLVTGHKVAYFEEAAEMYATSQRTAAFTIANNTLEEQNEIAKSKLKSIENITKTIVKHAKKCRPDETGHGVTLILAKAILDITSHK